MNPSPAKARIINEETKAMRCSCHLLVNILYKKGMQLVELTEKAMENNRMATVPTNNKADTAWASQCCKVETLRY
jgi:hypothetical protein